MTVNINDVPNAAITNQFVFDKRLSSLGLSAFLKFDKILFLFLVVMLELLSNVIEFHKNFL